MARTVPGERYQPRLHTIDETRPAYVCVAEQFGG
jgi:hypothetical protein